MAYVIAHGSPAHAGRLREIERAAGDLFRTIGMADVAENEPSDCAFLEQCARDGRLYVAIAPSGEVAGFLVWSPLDGAAYIEEVSVHPDHAGRRLAALMIDRLADDIRTRLSAITLATFRDVPWNAPYYARLGFDECSGPPPGPEHAQAWGEQAEAGLDMSRRMFMIRRL